MNRLRGFTLMELMVVIGIIGIIAAIAFPSYTDYVRKSKRSEAMAAVMEGANTQEKWMNVNNTYANALYDPFNGQATYTTPTGAYLVSVVATATTFTITATAQGSQVGDTEAGASCATLTINQRGVKGPVGSEACWR